MTETREKTPQLPAIDEQSNGFCGRKEINKTDTNSKEYRLIVRLYLLGEVSQKENGSFRIIGSLSVPSRESVK